MATNKPTARKKGATTPKKTKGVSVKQQKSQNYIKRVSDEATKIQKAGGKKTIPAKTVYSINRADAVKRAAKKVK